MAEGKRVINVQRDYFENVQGDVKTGASIHGDNAQQQINAQEFAAALTPQSSPQDVAKLLQMLQQDVQRLNVPEAAKEEALTELKSAENQVKKEQPDKPKIADRLKGAWTALKEAGNVGVESVALGNAIGKAILWCGEHWVC